MWSVSRRITAMRMLTADKTLQIPSRVVLFFCPVSILFSAFSGWGKGEVVTDSLALRL